MEAIESRKEDQRMGTGKWGLRLLIGGVIVAIGNDLWELLRKAIEIVAATFL